ncbi:hypothetical protein K1719_040489 [Acacia pycnantha]|nr:hypothetical protein K1719_040489 [Acacia pycnantha]
MYPNNNKKTILLVFNHDLESLPFHKSRLVLDWSIVDEATFQQPPALSTSKPISNPYASSHKSPSGFGYRCSCKAGFQGNPYLPDGCQDVNECDPPNSAHNCDIKGQALRKNFYGGYNCTCPPGYTGDSDFGKCTDRYK